MTIKSYQGSFEINNFNLIKYSLVVLFFLIILFCIIVFNNNFYDYYSGYGILEKKNELSILVDIRDLNKVTSNSEIIIERTTFSYSVASIGDKNIEYGTNILKKVKLNIDLSSYLNIDNNYFSYKIITGKSTIVQYVFNTIKGE